MRYYFGVRDGVPARDRTGSEFKSISEAILHAQKLAAALRSKQKPKGQNARVCAISQRFIGSRRQYVRSDNRDRCAIAPEPCRKHRFSYRNNVSLRWSTNRGMARRSRLCTISRVSATPSCTYKCSTFDRVLRLSRRSWPKLWPEVAKRSLVRPIGTRGLTPASRHFSDVARRPS
jgi:hypothetical protein